MFAHNVIEYGAKGMGIENETRYLQDAIDACSEGGGGIVFVPPGTYLVGGLRLKDNVHLELWAGAVLKAIPKAEDHSFETDGIEGRAVVYAYGAKHVAITGDGCLDGNGAEFYAYAGELKDYGGFFSESVGWAEITQSYYRPKERPRQTLALIRCRHCRVTGITIRESPCWGFLLLGSRDIKISGITIISDYRIPNSDGIDVDSSQDVIIEGCNINTADDAIVLKTTSIYGVLGPTRNVVVSNCHLSSSANAFKIGTESLSDFENIVFANSTVYSDLADYRSRAIGGISLETVDGGSIRGVMVNNVTMMNVRCPIFMTIGKRGKGHGSAQETRARSEQGAFAPGRLENVIISNVVIQNAMLTSLVLGMKDRPIRDVSFSNIQILAEGGCKEGDVQQVVEERNDRYPQASSYYRWMPGSGFYVRHARNVGFKDVWVDTVHPDVREGFHFEDTTLATALSATTAPTLPRSGQV